MSSSGAFGPAPSFVRSAGVRFGAAPLTVLALAAALAGCQPKPATPTTTGAAPTAVPGQVAMQTLAPVPMTQAPQAAGAQAPQAAVAYPQVGTVAPAGVPVAVQPVPAAAPPTTVAMAPQTPVYTDAGPPPPVAAPVAPAQVQPQRAPVPARAVAPPSGRVGHVTSIEPIREKPAGTGVGGVAGGALGALVGNQFGHGNGRAAMTVLGLAGGAVAGNTVERNIRERTVGYRVEVQLDNGEHRSVETANAADLRVGDRVRLANGGVRRI